ncbi:MAG TPA: EAL domain-containing protein [Dokdonella sp.]|uniref:bifunctional diguanylate cyclase/phosphodiesterase n=1 Tax=Dokdonella sp. TaxID=2291710 RepID=UPI002D800682|nr:EAL domain-containing protein [Dokdonella sp.]HET9033188.1 EAL domain-containing protein [Dokdonella sp.]
MQQALYTIANLVYSNLDTFEMLARIHDVVGKLTYAENFLVALYDDARDVMAFAYYADADGATPSYREEELHASDYPNSLTFAVLHGGRSLLGSSVALRKQLGLARDYSLGPECVDWLGVPMIEGDCVRGAVAVQSYDENRRYSEDDRNLLTFVAQHILSAVTRKQAHEELELKVLRRTAELADINSALREEVTERQHAQRLQAAMFRITELASERGSIDEFYSGVHGVVGELLNARNFFISLISEDRNELSFPYFVDERDLPLSVRRMTNGITEWVLRHRKPLLATETDIRSLMDAGEMVMFGTLPKCWLGVPSLLDEHAVGAMVVQSYDAESDYGPAEQEILQFASFHIATALERKRIQEGLRQAHADLERRVEERTEELKLANEDLYKQIAVRKQAESQLMHEAFHDGLTGLPNRAALLLRLQELLLRYRDDRQRLFAVLFLDLDRFKVVNDSVGHLLGDELLVEAAERITRCIRKPNSVARLGGDEFTVLLEDIDSVEDACRVANDLLATLVDPIRLGDKEIYTSASIGIALSHPRYTRPEELLRDADVAMYRAKAHGRQRFELFDDALRQEALNVLDLESDMRRALTRDEFEPYLQPIVQLADGRVLGYEALLRWRHHSRGLLLPEDFLAVAEESGNVEQIDWLLYEKVCKSIASLDNNQAYVSINVSARHFRSPNLVANLLDMLKAYRIPNWRVRIEVTEGALLQEPAQASATILKLRDAGILTSLDDFGTGYSSLSYLHSFPLHALKIDRSFVAELKSDLSGSSAAVVRAILALAGSLNLEVVAEGIETTSQCQALMKLECSIGQGYLFAHPRPAIEMNAVT